MTHKAIYMKRIILGSSLLFCALFTAPAMHAQESVEVLIRENGTERQESIELPKSMTYPLDSLLNDWKAKNYIDLGKDCSTSTVNPMFSDSVYIDRLSRMPTVMEMPYNEIVRKFIDMYAGRLRNQVAFMLSACNFYMPIFEEALDAYGLPLELKYLPIIESALNPSAVSRAGACGLWQFMPTTGREFGLEVNENVDERYHIEKATVAACKYFKQAYAKYGDWIAVSAAYNAGQARISSQLEKQLASHAMDLWLVEETSRYMFRLLAAKEIFSNPQRYGFLLKREHLYPPIPYKEVTVSTPINDLSEYAKKQGITYAQLRDANPWLRETSLKNRSGKSYVLHIPTQEGMHYDPKKTVAYNKHWVID